MTNRWNLALAAACGITVLLSQVAAQAQVRPGAKAKVEEKSAPRVTKKPVTPDDAKDRGKDAKDEGKDRAKDAKDRVKDARDDVKDRTKDAKEDVKDRAKDAKDDTRDRAKDSKDRAKDAKDDVKDRAGDAKDDVKDRVKDRAKDAKDTAKDARDDAKKGARQARKFDAAKVKTDDLGITLKEADKSVTVSNVTNDSVLANAGFRTGDHIVSVDGQNVVRQSDFVNYLFTQNSSGRIPVVVMRDGSRSTIYVRPTTIIRDYERVVVDDHRNPIRDFGLVLDDRNDGRLIVDRVIRDTRADHAGIKVDDEILAVNDRDLDSRKELANLLEKYEGERIDMEVRRDREAKVLEVKTIR